MLFSLLPMGLIPAVSGSDSFGNMTAGGVVTIKPGTGAGSVDWNNNLNSMHGYKISVWYAVIDEVASTPEKPVYKWDSTDSSECFQIGENIYFRDSYLALDNGTLVSPSVWGKGNVFSLTTQGRLWSETRANGRIDTFRYYATESTVKDGNTKTDYFNGNTAAEAGTEYGCFGSKNFAISYAKEYLNLDISDPAVLQTLAEDHPDWNDGQKSLQDWINRIFDMSNPSNPNYSSGDRIQRNTDIELPFAAATKAKDGVIESAEYIKSYFLNPTILNQIAYTTATCADYPTWLVEDFILGRYQGWEGNREAGEFQFEKGQYKIFIEPCMFRPYYGANGVMTWREMMSEYLERINVGEWGSSTAVVNLGNAITQVANALILEEGDPVLKVNGQPIQSSSLMGGDWDAPANIAKNDPTNGLGVGIVTSPSLNSYPQGPTIIKTYVQVTSIDEEGNIEYKQIANPVIEQADKFYIESELQAIDEGTSGYNYTGDGNAITNVPNLEDDIEEYIQNDEFVGKAVLNDIVSSIPQLNKNVSWVNELLPRDDVTQLQPIATDVMGSTTGIMTNQAVEVDGVVGCYVDEKGWITTNPTEESLFVSLAETSNTMANMIKESRSLLMPFGLPVTGVTSKVYETLDEIRLGLVDKDNNRVITFRELEQPVDSAVGTIGMDTTDLLVLRYIVFPDAAQLDVVEIYDEKTNTSQFITIEPRPLDKNGDTVNIQVPEVNLPEGAGDMELIEWVTNPEIPFHDISNGNLPSPPSNGLTGNTQDPIPNYPTEPNDHNLYVKWKVIIPAPPEPGELKDSVPEWRLSKYRPSLLEGFTAPSASMFLSLSSDSTTHVTSTLSPSGTYNFDTINPNGQKTVSGYSPDNMNMKTITTQWLSAYGSVPANTFFHSKAIPLTSASISHSSPYAYIQLDGNLNMIKSFDTAKINAASWLTNDATVKGLEQHNIKTDVKPIGYSGSDNYDKSSDLKYGIYNRDTYTHQIAVYYHYTCGSEDCGGHCGCYLTPETFTPSEGGGVSYNTADYHMTVNFERYVQKNTDSLKLKVSPEINKIDTLTTIKYQLTDTLNVYPEIGMLFVNDQDAESIKWVVGDQARKISPVVWQTLDHKVYVVPTSSGTSVATDSRAITKAQSLGEANKQVIHKGAGVNTTFQLFRDSDVDSKAILTVKTFALDFASSSSKNANILLNGVDVKSAWGNSNYNSQTQHDALISAVKATGKADATEKLLVDINFGGNAEYVGGEKKQKTADYKVMTYDGKEVNMFEHQLIVRGGSLIAVGYNDRSSTNATLKWYKPEELKDVDLAFYNAMVGMNLYNESGDRSKTVFSTFEHLAGDTLTEEKYSTDLETARNERNSLLGASSITTPDASKVVMNKGWYSEDTTVLVIKEYVTNFEVPSISFGDKLSMSVGSLTTPMDKSQFYSQMGKGYVSLKYDLPINDVYDGVDSTSAYFEFTSLPTDTVDKVARPDRVDKDENDMALIGKETTNYLVPNVSITDTTRLY